MQAVDTTYLSPEELRQLSKSSTLKSWLHIAFDWLLITATFWLTVEFPHPVVYFLTFWLMARHQLALAILMHDGAHRRLFPTIRSNDVICQIFCASPLLFSMYSYQKLHLKHHRNPLAADDPDLSLIGGYPISKTSFLRKLFRDAIGLSYFKFIRYFIHMAQQSPAQKNDGQISKLKTKSTNFLSFPLIVISVLFVNVLLFSSLYSLGHGWLYLTHWLLPMFTALQVLLRIRGVAEHAGYQPNPDQRLNARTVVNPLQTFFFAPHNVNYHIEHHLYPGIPFYNLPKTHKIFIERNVIPKQNLYYGYRSILREIIR